MAKRKFILLSILKTFLFSAIISWILFFILLSFTRRSVDENYHHNCDMSGLAYAISLGIIIMLSLSSFTALLSLLRFFQNTIRIGLCWFLLPLLITLYSYVSLSDGKLDFEGIGISFILYVPWFSFWGLYYYRYKKINIE
jgi:heme/copper-type cytochrome/quinol oxidase subunit 2